MEPSNSSSVGSFRGNFDNDASFEDLVQNESLAKEKALLRIKVAKRNRSHSIDSNDAVDQEVLTTMLQKTHMTEVLEENDEGDLSDATENEEDREDMRPALFQSIPEPYPHTLNFQRVIVTQVEEDSRNPDTIDACTRLKRCMELRNKWISAHPSPPQDATTTFDAYEDVFVPLSPSRNPSFVGDNWSHGANSSVNTSSVVNVDGTPKLVAYRRRLPPKYEIFEQQIPHSVTHLQYRMERGIVRVRHATDASNSRNKIGGVGSKSGDERDRLNSDDISIGLTITSEHNTPLLQHQHQHQGSAASSLEADISADPATASQSESSLFPVLSYEEFCHDYRELRKAVYSGPVLSYSYKRLEVLAAKFNLHILLNSERELEAQKSVPHRDMYNCRKVDTHVHHSASMNQKHLLRFIKHKLKHFPHDKVIFRDGKKLTLGEVFKSLNLTAYDLSIDTLDMHAHNTFHRFDRFNLKYNPAGQSRLREIFLKTDNAIKGKYLADITNEMIQDLDASKYTLVEWRISIYGRSPTEWNRLAEWFYNNRLAHQNVRWLIQIPRLYSIYKESGTVKNFGEMLENIFLPLFEVSLNPSIDPPLHLLLQTVVGIDSVDDESRPEYHQLSENLPNPDEWDSPHNPPYSYWMYYTYANLCVLNKLRASRGLCTFQFRPHCGEAGDIDHLMSTYLVAHQINHGILLRKNASLQFLYYLSQIGIAMSPLSNNKLFIDYNKNPFPRYFCIGMNVSLSTDDPLMLHFTKDALLEEYSVAAQVWKLSSADQCEIARNSVLQSGFENRYKLHFLGHDYSDIRETNVPEIRLMFRKEALASEIEHILSNTSSTQTASSKSSK